MVVAERIDHLNGSASVPWTATRLQPVTVNLPNDHLQYAITWFSLAAVWSLMTILWLWRIRRGSS